MQEDAELTRLVQSHSGTLTCADWTRIGNVIGKSSKQCRERFCNVLDPSLTNLRTPWTEEELDLLFHAQKTLGSKWSKIAEVYFKGRCATLASSGGGDISIVRFAPGRPRAPCAPLRPLPMLFVCV